MSAQEQEPLHPLDALLCDINSGTWDKYLEQILSAAHTRKRQRRGEGFRAHGAGRPW